MNDRVIKLTDLECEKINACIMLVAKDFEIQCYKNNIDISSTDEIAEKARYYFDLAQKFKGEIR